MRRIVLLLGVLSAFLSVTESSAQIKYGVKGGLNLSDVVIMDTWRGSSEKNQSISIYNIVCKKNAETWVNWNTSYANETGRSRFHAWQFSIGYYF